ncbi:MAG: aromatic amino acid transport family protein [Spirochaetota bacterium]
MSTNQPAAHGTEQSTGQKTSPAYQSGDSLSFLEASSLIMGAGVGGGIMAVPYLASRPGPTVFIIVLAVAYLVNLALHLMLVEVLFRDGRDLQILELAKAYVFRGRFGRPLVWILFAVLLVSFVANLTAYISGAGDIFAEILGLRPLPARLVLYGLSAGVVYLGLKAIGMAEKLALGGIAAIIILLVTGVHGYVLPFGIKASGGWEATLGLYGMVMYGLYAFFAVPQVVRGLRWSPRLVAPAIATGLGMNAFLTLFLTILALGLPGEPTEVAVIGIARSSTPLSGTAAMVFIILAMLTSYWSVSLALRDIVLERTGLRPRLAWLLVTLPTLGLIIYGRLGFLEYLKIAGGITGLVVVFLTLPMYLQARKLPLPASAPPALGGIMRPWVMGLLLVGMLLMAIGSLLGV